MTKILITGGAGFIGSHFTKYLTEQGNQVVVVDTLLRGNKIDRDILKSIELHNLDIRDYESILRLSRNCDFIYHFAAVLGVDIVADSPIETMEVEVVGMKNLCQACHINGIRKIIYASTSGVYGHSALEKSVTEDIILDPRTSYSIAKRFNEIYLAAQYEERELESISLRFFNVYGPKQDKRMVIPKFFEQALENRTITVYGSGNQTRDFTYIDDVVKATELLREKFEGCGIFNIANEKELTIFELAEKIKNITNSKSEIKKTEVPDKRYDFEVERRFGNSEKLYSLTGFKPDTEIEKGLMDFYKSIKK